MEEYYALKDNERIVPLGRYDDMYAAMDANDGDGEIIYFLTANSLSTIFYDIKSLIGTPERLSIINQKPFREDYVEGVANYLGLEIEVADKYVEDSDLEEALEKMWEAESESICIKAGQIEVQLEQEHMYKCTVCGRYKDEEDIETFDKCVCKVCAQDKDK